MGWNEGKGVARAVWKEIREHHLQDQIPQIAARLVKVFEAYDCDTLDELDNEIGQAARLARGLDKKT